MIKGATAICMALIFCGTEAASAQTIEQRLHQVTDEWINTTGEFVPGAVRRQYFKGISNQISREARSLGPRYIDEVSEERRAKDAKKSVAIATDRLATPKNVGLWLQKFPTIRVVVQPTPPKEFLLTINGEQCPATEKALYRVPAGSVTIRVWREGGASCEKTYDTVEGQVYDVQCAF